MTYQDSYSALPDPEYQAEFYADVPFKRLIAWILDTVIVVAFLVLAVILTIGIGAFFAGFLFLVFGFGYRVVTLANGSATLGMRIMSIEMRMADGRPFDVATAVLHTLGYYASMAFIVVQFASIVMMLTNQRGQGLTDMVLGTTALNRRARH